MQVFENINEDERSIRVTDIFEEYISSSAQLQVNIPGKQRTAISTVVGGDKSAYTKNMFESAENEIYKLMVRDNYARFKRTKEFSEFFKSLGILIQNKALLKE